MIFEEKMFEMGMESEWGGYKRLDFKLNGRDVILILPKENDPQMRWMLKTEYFGAFPNFEIAMLERGWHLAYIRNSTRWHNPEDDDAKELLCQCLHEKFGLNEKCLPVGMSCGGMQGIYFAAKYPERVHALYIDAPVTNLLSCPCGVGIEGYNLGMYNEMVKNTDKNLLMLLNYRNHPVDKVSALVENKVSVLLVCGDSDRVVPFNENGKAFYERYKELGGDITLILKEGCDHHPHGLEDPTPIIEFALKHS